MIRFAGEDLPNQRIRDLFPRLIGDSNAPSVALVFNTQSMSAGTATTVQMVIRQLTSTGLVDNGHQLQSNTRREKMNDPESTCPNYEREGTRPKIDLGCFREEPQLGLY